MAANVADLAIPVEFWLYIRFRLYKTTRWFYYLATATMAVKYHALKASWHYVHWQTAVWFIFKMETIAVLFLT